MNKGINVTESVSLEQIVFVDVKDNKCHHKRVKNTYSLATFQRGNSTKENVGN